MEVTRKSLFLRGLQAAYAHVLEVYEDACHVAVYRFFPDRKKWEKMEIEGSAYLTRNSCAPFYSLIVLNKKGDTDLILHVEENIEKVKVQEDYIMLRCLNPDGQQVVFGMWVHAESERTRLLHAIQRTKDLRKHSPDVTSLFSSFLRTKPLPSSTPSSSESSTAFIASATTSSVVTPESSLSSALTNNLNGNSERENETVVASAMNKAAALLSALKQPPPSSTSSSSVKASPSLSPVPPNPNSDGNCTLDQLIEASEQAQKPKRSSPAVNPGQRLLSALTASTSTTPSTSASSTAAVSSDFPTDREISDRRRQQSNGVSLSPSLSGVSLSSLAATTTTTATATAVVPSPSPQKKVDALKAALSIGGNNNNKPTKSLSPSLTVKRERSERERERMSPVTLPPPSSSTSVTPEEAVAKISPVTITRRPSPPTASVSEKRVPKLISPADLEVF